MENARVVLALNGPHAVHHVDLPCVTLLVLNVFSGFRRQLRHAEDHVGVVLQEVSLLVVPHVDVSEVAT